MGSQEARRSARIAASFWIGVEGIDKRPVRRRGNLSATGMYFESSTGIGEVGSMQFLHIASEDHRVVVQMLTRIIRVNQYDDLRFGRYLGVALEFMPSSIEARESLERLVRHVVELGLSGDSSVDYGFDVDVEGHSTERTSLRRLGIQRLVLETEWAAQIGDRLEIDIRSPGHSGHVPLEGQVTSVDMSEAGFRVAVRVTGAAPRPKLQSDPDTDADITNLFVDGVDDFEMPARDSLMGELARIKVPTLLGLLELEKMTGELHVTSPQISDCTLYVREGRIVDAEDEAGQAELRSLLSTLIQCDEGEFRFSVCEVDRSDQVQASTMSLLLDVAREHDELSQDPITETDEDFF